MIEGHEGGMPPQERKKTLEREWKEVPRPYEVGIVSDLNGSFYTFIKSVTNLGYARVQSRDGHNFMVDEVTDADSLAVENFFQNYELVWTGGNKRLVFLGDIVGDRQGWGGSILEGIEQLEEQAKQEGGEIIILAGNHDIEALLLFISGDDYSKKINVLQCLIPELHPYEKTRIVESVEIPSTKQVLDVPYCMYDKEKFLADPKIVALIERMKKMDLIAYVDDTLMVHADSKEDDFFLAYEDFEKPLKKEKGFQVPVKEVVDAINKEFQDIVNQTFVIEVLPDGAKKIKINMSQALRLMGGCNSFIAAFSGWPHKRKRDIYSDEFETFLKKRGINLFVHGHTSAQHKQKQDFVLSLSPYVGIDFYETKGDYSNTARILPDDAQSQKGSVEVGIEADLWNTVRSA